MILYDFKCSHCDYVFEKFAGISDKTCECTHCGSQADRLVSTPTIKLDPLTFPGAKMKWIKQHEQAGKKSH